MSKKIVLVGGPGSGKSSVIYKLEQEGYHCLHEVAREIIINAQKEGIDQLFLEDPILFSKMLLEEREKQFFSAEESSYDFVFFDRGIPSIEAYMKYSGDSYPEIFTAKSQELKYDRILYFPPWEDIYKSDNERYETFDQAKEIDKAILSRYKELGYDIVQIPFGTIEERCQFIINNI